MQFSFIWPIDRALSSATTLGQSDPGSYGNEGVLRIPQNFSITPALDCLVSYPDTRWGGVLSLCIDAVGVFYSPSRLSKVDIDFKSCKHNMRRSLIGDCSLSLMLFN